ncbi:hypothetical protein GQ607_017577 [Colletotrichum asianum]|uniref:Uncharacterized protein n=1 Tax=Colletotrichum asianum TaxID=702518 RepID=A0A8H3VW30_9PEZI|nr:hypothetical protein GQ607_017577 [Colletotrichum asianum]
MKRTRFHRWGFVIYRTTYEDDAAWERYLEVVKFAAQWSPDYLGGDVLLEQYMDWPVISDKATLDGASKADVRKHFQSWCEARSEERDGPGATRAGRLPRFNYCVYVDRKCLDTLAMVPENYFMSSRLREQSNLVAVMLDKKAPGNRRDVWPEVEGCTGRYVGWRYEEVDMLVGTYEESHMYDLSHIDYKRPPLISPSGRKSMPA